MGQVHLTPLQFSNLEVAAKESKQVDSVIITSPNTGIINTHDVTVDYIYNPVSMILQFNIGAKHSLAAKVAGDNVISNHITALIFNLEGLNNQPTVQEEPNVGTSSSNVSEGIESSPEADRVGSSTSNV